MNRNALNLVLLTSLVVALALNWAIRVDHRRPNREFMPNMVESVAFSSYADNPHFADGKTLRSPPQGTLRRGEARIDYPPDSTGAALAGMELTNPYTLDSISALSKGDYVYRDFCQPCHGSTGMGDGPVSLRGFPPPPSLTAPNAIGLPDGRLVHIITYGQANMPGYAAQILLDDRWKAVLHIRSLQQKAAGVETAKTTQTNDVTVSGAQK